MSFIYDFINSSLVFLYGITGNLGLTIILFTGIVRAVLLPLTIPSIRTQKQMKELQPELKALKQKHGSDKKAFQQAQLDLYKKYNMNPIAGCLPQLVQLGMLIVLYHALTVFLNQSEVNGEPINRFFLWLDLGTVDSRYVIPVLAGVSQFILSLMIAPGAEVRDAVPNQSSQKTVQEANKKEEDMADMAASMQQQMLFIMPVMTGVFAARFPSGLGLYWIATTVFSIAQQYFISGPGGLASYTQRAYQFVTGIASGKTTLKSVAQGASAALTAQSATPAPSSSTNDLAQALKSKKVVKTSSSSKSNKKRNKKNTKRK
jgi:YidC/Oxa1 family membrane protein insertase